MEISTLKKHPIDKLKEKLEKATLTWDESIQRSGGAWNRKQQSELIHSILANYYIPSMCFLKQGEIMGKKKMEVVYSVLDGKQRLTTIFKYMDEKGYPLHKETPAVEKRDGSVVEIAGKKFSELDEELQNIIKNFHPEIIVVDSYTEEEAEILFYRLNNGTPLTKIQQSRAVLGGSGANFVNTLLEMDFFKKCNLTSYQVSREDNLGAVMQAIMLMDESYQWQGIGAKDITLYCEKLRDDFGIELQCEIVKTLKWMSEVFSNENIMENIPIPQTSKRSPKKIVVPFLKKRDLTSIFYVSHELCKYNVDYGNVLRFFDEFFDESCETFKNVYEEEYCKDGTTHKGKVDGRNETLLKAAMESHYFDLSEGNRREDNILEEAKANLNEDGFISREYILG